MRRLRTLLTARMERGEEGLSLVEVLVSLMVLGFVMLTMTYSLTSGYSSLRRAKTTQTATSIGNEQIEAARDLTYDALALVDADLDPTTDSQVLTSCGTLGTGKFFDPDGSGPLNCERLVYSTTGGGIPQHMTTQALNGETYTVSRYVTWVDADAQGGADEDYKRIVTIVTWTDVNTTKTFRASTIVYSAPKGIPELRFEFTPGDQTIEVMQGERAVLVNTLVNLGKQETFDLSMPNPASKTWVKTFYVDVNGNTDYDAGVDTALTDTNGNGIPDTGLMDTDERMVILTSWVLSSTEPMGQWTMSFTATPETDPSLAQTVTSTIDVGTPYVTLYLHNYPKPPTANTNTTSNLPMDTDPPTATTLYRYSSNIGSYTGRVTIEAPASADQTDNTKMINWLWQSPRTITFAGTAEVRIRMEILPDGQGKCNQGDWNIYVREKQTPTSGTATTLLARSSEKDPGCGTFWQTETFTVARTTLTSSEWLELKISTSKVKGIGSRWEYDTVNAQAYLKMPAVMTRPTT